MQRSRSDAIPARSGRSGYRKVLSILAAGVRIQLRYGAVSRYRAGATGTLVQSGSAKAHLLPTIPVSMIVTRGCCSPKLVSEMMSEASLEMAARGVAQ